MLLECKTRSKVAGTNKNSILMGNRGTAYAGKYRRGRHMYSLEGQPGYAGSPDSWRTWLGATGTWVDHLGKLGC